MMSIHEILKESGYSEKAADLYINMINVGRIDKPSIRHTVTGSCGDTIEFYLSIESNLIQQAKFQAIGCAGIFISGSALTTLIIGKTPEEALRIPVKDIIGFLEKIPDHKTDCILLAKKTLEEAIFQISPRQK
jgi:nitrogen fixation NifU-like protein